MDRVIYLSFEVLIDADADYFKVMDDAFFALQKVPSIIEVDTADVEDLGLFDGNLPPYNAYKPKNPDNV